MDDYDVNYPIAFSYLCLGGISFYALSLHGPVRDIHDFKGVVFIGVATNSVVGAIRYGIKCPDAVDIKSVYNLSNKIQELTSLPFLAGLMNLRISDRWELQYAHPVSKVIPMGMYLSNNEDKQLEKAMIALDSLVVEFASVMQQSISGFAASVCHSCAYFIKDAEKILNDNDIPYPQVMPQKAAANYFYCLYVFFCMNLFGMVEIPQIG